MPTKVGGMEIKMKEIKNILFFIKYIKPQWKTLLTVIVLTIVATGIGLLFLIMILPEKAVRSEKMVKIQCDYIP